MSLVSDALKKAEQMRLQQAGVLGPGQRTVVRARPLHAGRLSASSAKRWWANMAVLAVVAAMAVQYLRQPLVKAAAGETKAVGAPETGATPAAGPDAMERAIGAPNASMDAVVAQSVQAEPAFALCGVTVAGKDTLVGVTRQSDGRSAWIAVGQTLGDVTVESYDAKREEATLRVNGQRVTAGMSNGAW